MVAVLADQGLPGATGQRAPGIGPDGRVVVVQTKLQLRQGDRLTYRRWDADFNNCASKGQLNGLLNNRAVPTVEAVQLSFKGQSPEQQLQTYNAALQRFQSTLSRPAALPVPTGHIPCGHDDGLNVARVSHLLHSSSQGCWINVRTVLERFVLTPPLERC